jgi:hypothetical protein
MDGDAVLAEAAAVIRIPGLGLYRGRLPGTFLILPHRIVTPAWGKHFGRGSV